MRNPMRLAPSARAPAGSGSSAANDTSCRQTVPAARLAGSAALWLLEEPGEKPESTENTGEDPDRP